MAFVSDCPKPSTLQRDARPTVNHHAGFHLSVKFLTDDLLRPTYAKNLAYLISFGEGSRAPDCEGAGPSWRTADPETT
jgi:hypothetical protein